MNLPLLLGIAVVAVLLLTPARFIVLALPAWLGSRREIPLLTLAGFGLQKVPSGRLVNAYDRIRAAGLAVEPGDLASFHLAEGDLGALARTIEARHAQGLTSDFYALSAVGLAGKLDTHGLAPDPVKSLILAGDAPDPARLGAE